MKPRCGRTWEAEAARDGRLGDDRVASHRRHVAHCVACAEECAWLERLGSTLREPSTPPLSELSQYRLRRRVLDAVHRNMVKPEVRVARRLHFVAASLAAAFVIASGAIGLRLLRAPGATATEVLTIDESGARWSRRRDENAERIDLTDGTLGIHVDRPAGGAPLVVRVPDGEIEDVGTVFHVEVAEGRTRRVHVDQGRVIVRVTSSPEATVAAGETWTPSLAPSSAVAVTAAPANSANAASAPASASTSTSMSSARPSDGDARPLSSPAARARTSPTSALSVPPAPSNAAPRPAAAGGVGIDASDEDVAYVEIVRLLQQGQKAQAKAAARDYVERYPHGFRRAEVDGVLANP